MWIITISLIDDNIFVNFMQKFFIIDNKIVASNCCSKGKRILADVCTVSLLPCDMFQFLSVLDIRNRIAYKIDCLIFIQTMTVVFSRLTANCTLHPSAGNGRGCQYTNKIFLSILFEFLLPIKKLAICPEHGRWETDRSNRSTNLCNPPLPAFWSYQ